MSLKTAAKCLEASPDPNHHIHQITLPKRLMRHPPASLGLRGLEKQSKKFFEYMNRLEDNEQRLLRTKENRERYSYNLRHYQGCKRYNDDAKTYFTKEEWVKECAEAAKRKFSPEANKKQYIYQCIASS